MISNILLLISLILTLIAYTRIILNYLTTKSIKIKDITGFDLAKELTSNYDEINIVETKDKIISKYNLKRNVIRLTEKDYTNNDIFTLTKSSLLSGYSLLNSNKDKYITTLKSILPNIDYLNKSAPIALVISLFTNTKGDAKIAIILLLIILIYQYIINTININSKEETKNQLTKILKNENYTKLEKVQNTYLFLNQISFIATLILLLRIVFIIIK